MTGKRPEPEDPLELVGVGFEREPDDAALEEMAWSFVQEYALMGWSTERILRMFKSPVYRGPHSIYHRMGEPFVQALLDRLDEIRLAVAARRESHQ